MSNINTVRWRTNETWVKLPLFFTSQVCVCVTALIVVDVFYSSYLLQKSALLCCLQKRRWFPRNRAPAGNGTSVAWCEQEADENKSQEKKRGAGTDNVGHLAFVHVVVGPGLVQNKQERIPPSCSLSLLWWFPKCSEPGPASLVLDIKSRAQVTSSCLWKAPGWGTGHSARGNAVREQILHSLLHPFHLDCHFPLVCCDWTACAVTGGGKQGFVV